MLECEQCKGKRLVDFSAKCSDLSHTTWWPKEDGICKEQDGYVPHVLGIGGGDYVEMCFCVECGQIQNYETDWKANK